MSLKILTKFQENIKFTYKVEHNGTIMVSFLDVLLIRGNRKLERTVFCKETKPVYNGPFYRYPSLFVCVAIAHFFLSP